MVHQVRLPGETFCTLGAGEWFLVPVYLLVAGQKRLPDETLPTFRAGKWLVLGVNPAMLYKLVLRVEGLPTFKAWEGSLTGGLARMCFLVGHKVGFLNEIAAAFMAREELIDIIRCGTGALVYRGVKGGVGKVTVQ